MGQFQILQDVLPGRMLGPLQASSIKVIRVEHPGEPVWPKKTKHKKTERIL